MLRNYATNENVEMKTKNTSNQWRETATLPHSGDWSWKPKKSKRVRRKSTLAKSAKKVAPKRKPIVVKQSKIVSTITLESLGLSFTPTAQIQASIV
jgi:phage repressor protein C with HTH and peptisase S24 domain